MADLNAKIDDIVAGDDYDIVRDVTNVPIGQFLVQAWLTIKENHWDASKIIQKVITADISPSGIILDTGVGDTDAIIRFSLYASDTVNLHEFYEYQYDIQVKTDTGKIYTPESGTLVAHRSVTSEVI